MVNDGLKFFLVATVSAVALLTAFTPVTANAFNVAVHTSGTAAYASKKNRGLGGIESKFLKQCAADVAKAENTKEFLKGKFGYYFNANQIERVEDCVDAKLEDSKPTVDQQLKGFIIGVSSIAGMGFGLSWIFGSGLDNFNRRRYIEGLKKGMDEDTQNAIDRIIYEKMSTSHLYGAPSLSEKFRLEIRKPEPDLAMIAGYSKIHGVDNPFYYSSGRNHFVVSPLYAAILCKKPDVVKALVSAGADVNAETDGLLPLDHAKEASWSCEKSEQIIKTLTEAGAISIRDKEPTTNKIAEEMPKRHQFQNWTAGRSHRVFSPK